MTDGLVRSTTQSTAQQSAVAARCANQTETKRRQRAKRCQQQLLAESVANTIARATARAGAEQIEAERAAAAEAERDRCPRHKTFVGGRKCHRVKARLLAYGPAVCLCLQVKNLINATVCLCLMCIVLTPGLAVLCCAWMQGLLMSCMLSMLYEFASIANADG